MPWRRICLAMWIRGQTKRCEQIATHRPRAAGEISYSPRNAMPLGAVPS